MNTMAAALVLSWFFTGLWITLMQALGLGKQVRLEGPQSHLNKAGTPSMGGVAFLLAAALVYALSGGDRWAGLWLLVLGMALLGLADDLAGSLRRPLRAREKLAVQALMSLTFALWATRLVQYTPYPALDVLLIALVIIAACNAFNFTDGVDGLLASVTAVLLLPFLGLPTAQAALGGLLGFLWYNAPRATVFMGDTGSMALGALVAGLFILEGKLWWLPLAALIPVLEVLSVVVQVAYFRRTGQRLLKMSPLHHHFELSGWSESKVVFRFVAVTALATALAVHLWGGRG
ncbi:Phospho-N-acetylmuramoyl-pentapeptide-transferase [Meiothermus luteus]|jgi:phospho-N-acetylmuramoyl-pentapeptide-transferase|uniref:Phospho-N-acetylmuramoyl-pentapeptide-transferase n=2 Tax=Meiothermus luteus TaxID=2026184 RepID=A0A399ESD5_9DEIN|nr:Phospho-N-acetylmuramoyl-pentapeptide-transferase [Meiothermus luteus]RMH56549.1 MAG: phospho-N-acetylmuramoyl-pentapeptide-transferase [Deinococcota bacterium]